MNSSDPLTTLKGLTQNFPKHMLSLAHKVELNTSFEEEIRDNSGSIQTGVNLLWVNGLLLQEGDVSPYGYDTVKSPLCSI